MEEMTSPSVNKGHLLISFSEALTEMLLGKKITKKEWNNEEEYGFMKDEILHIRRGGKDHGWLISRADIEGEDYYSL